MFIACIPAQFLPLKRASACTASKQQMMAEKKAFLVINKFVKANENPWIEGVFWKKKHAREYARQLIRKTGTLNYKFLYSIITYRFG